MNNFIFYFMTAFKLWFVNNINKAIHRTYIVYKSKIINCLGFNVSKIYKNYIILAMSTSTPSSLIKDFRKCFKKILYSCYHTTYDYN